MIITIKEYSKEYTDQCAELLQHLWKEDEKDRIERFNWTYNECPNYNRPLSVIAVNENNEVMGFRGYFINKFLLNQNQYPVAQIADTVVSPKARRMGIFQKMNVFSISLLEQNNISFILNTGPSWPPYYGNKKIGFKDLSHFHSLYKFSAYNMAYEKIFKHSRTEWNNRDSIKIKDKHREVVLSKRVDDNILNQLAELNIQDKIVSSLDFENIKWRIKRPNRNYIFAYSVGHNNKLTSFIMLGTKDYYNYNIGFTLIKNKDDLKRVFKIFRKKYKPASVAIWDFAIDKLTSKTLKKIGFIKIPFINRIRKNPPALIRTLKTKNDGSLDWYIDGIDIQNIDNWRINKIDQDSF